MSKTNINKLTSIFIGVFLSIALTVPGLADNTVPALPTVDTETVIDPAVPGADAVTMVEPAGQQSFFVGLQPQHKLYVQGYLIDALHFAHNSYGYVAWSMRSSRRNLQETLFEVHLKQLEYFIAQTIGLADLSMRLTPDSNGLPEIKVQLEELSRAVKLMLEENKVAADVTEPGSKVIESGKIHEQVGKAIPALVANLQKALQEQASASAQLNFSK
ncbi:MAG: hypothetical protein KKB51_16350 [Candidatus Riflebacteria bacterium]|nr:hypothetical protein [Candidatus Riflebacteria bacterium]